MPVTPPPPAFNDWDLVSLSGLPVGVHVAAAIVVIVALFVSWRSTRGAPRIVRAGLIALRALLGVCLLVVLVEPGRRLLAVSQEPERVVVAVDVSSSMAVGEGTAQRSRVAARTALDVVRDMQSRTPVVVPEVWLFGDALTTSSIEVLEGMRDGAVPPQAPQSKLSLPVLVGDTDGAGAGLPLGAVVVVSDGADTTGLSPSLTTELRERLTRLGKDDGGTVTAPLHTITVGADSGFKDIVLERAIADEFAFVRNPVTVEVVLRQRGFAGTALPLTLAEDGVVVARADVTLAANSSATGEQRATFTFTPQRAGKRLYTVQAPVLAGEAIAENNRLDFTMKLIRDRIRVLQVAGRPSWDERFVRRLLKENPSVDLISFFILRTPSDISGAPNNELSLIPFPTRELFTEQLGTFDVVIFQDFNYRPYNMGIYLKNVADYIVEGGGFLMIGGELSFSDGDYDGTPIADVLPVRLLPGRGHTSTDDFVPRLTDVGSRHPITDISGAVVGARRDDVYAALPPLQGINRTAGLADGAAALLVHPADNGPDGQPQPVIAVRDVGKGRSVAVMTDTTWHWALPQTGQGGGRSDAHRRLLANTLRWLIRDPELSRVKLTLDADPRGTEPGKPVTATVRAQDALYQAEPDAVVKVTLTPLDLGQKAPAVQPTPETTGADGSARVTLSPDAAGAYRVRAEVRQSAERGGELVGVDEDVFVVRQASLERLFGEARPDLMAALAAAGGGRAVTPDDATGLDVARHGKVRIHRQKTEPVWPTALTLAVLVTLAAAEWWWRRRRGFA